MSNKIDYTPKVDALLEHCAALGFTERDFADLAVAAADQAGMSAKDGVDLRAMLAMDCENCTQPIGAYRPTDEDQKTAPAAGLCEECHQLDVRLMDAQRAEEIREGRGDYMRDQQKDRDRLK